MGNELVVRKQQEMTFDEMTRAAKAMAMSGYFSDAKDVSQAMVKVLAGQELGIGPFSAMSSIHVIKGKPVLGANLIATLIKNDQRYNYRVAQLDDDGCVIEFYENGEQVGTSSFTAKDAKAAGLRGDNWSKYPRNMFFARAISNGAKWYTPGVFSGATVYTADEMGVEEDEDGGIIDVTPPVDTDTGEILDGDVVEFDDLRSATEEDAPDEPPDTRGATSPQSQAKRERPAAAKTNGDGASWKEKALKAKSLPEFASAAAFGLDGYKNDHHVTAALEGVEDFEYNAAKNEVYWDWLSERKTEEAAS